MVTGPTNIFTACDQTGDHILGCVFSKTSLLFVNHNYPPLDLNGFEEPFIDPVCSVSSLQ
jgi:hypothetical protein